MFSWLKFWGRKPAPPALPSAEEIARLAADAVRRPSGPPSAPRYSFRAADAGFSPSPPRPDAADEPILGIDLGTTRAAAAVVLDRQVIPLLNQEGELLTPCVVGHDGRWLVGEAADRRAVVAPAATARGFVRWLATGPRTALGGEDCPPSFLAGLILAKLRGAAEARLGRRVRRAVVTVPAWAGHAHRHALVEAAQIAGLDADWRLTDPASGREARVPMRLLARPVAAALGYALTTAHTRDRRIAVVHLGGGGCQVAVMNVGDGVFDVEGVGGEDGVGGSQLDIDLAERFGLRGMPDHDPLPAARLLAAVEQGRRDLDQHSTIDLVLPWLAEGRDFRATLTRDHLDAAVERLAARWRATIDRVVKTAHSPHAGPVAEVVCCGRLSRMPAFRAAIRATFGGSAVYRDLSPEVAAAGAAIQGDQLSLGSRSDVLIVNALARDVRARSAAGPCVPLLRAGTRIPTEGTETVALPARDGKALVRLVAGESEDERANELIGEVCLGTPTSGGVEVTCSVDVSGRISVGVKGRASIPVTPPGLDDEERRYWRRTVELHRVSGP